MMGMKKSKKEKEPEAESPKPLPPEEALAMIKVQEQRLRRIQFLGIGYGVLFLGLGGFIFRSFPIILGIFLGALIVVANFFWLTRLVRRAFLTKKKPSKRFFVKFGLKFFLLLAIVTLVIYFTPVNPVAFLAGLSVSVFGIMTDGVIGVFKKER